MSKGSLFSGIFSLLVCISLWVIVALFLTENEFNPIQDALDKFFPKLEEFHLQQKNATIQEGKFNETDENLRNYVEEIKVFCPTLITATLVISVVYALFTILMMITTKFQLNRGFMIPYLSLQFFFVIVLIYNSFFLNLTLVLMPHDLSGLSTGSFIMFILINIFMACTFSLSTWGGEETSIFSKFAFGTGYMVNVVQTYQFAYYGNVLTSLTSLQLHIHFAVCLYFVLKDFTRNELEPQDEQ